MFKHLALIAFPFVLAACGGGATSQPVPDSTAIALAEAEGIVVRFTEEECSHTGPLELPVGEYMLIFEGIDGNTAADFYVQRINDGWTYQDIVDLQGGIPGNNYAMPDFITYATVVDAVTDVSTGDRRVTYSFDEGEYYIDAFKMIGTSLGAWLCGAITFVAE